MSKINPPRPKGQRRQPTRQVTMYQANIKTLDALVQRKNTTRAEYLRWLVECAEAELVAPTPGDAEHLERLLYRVRNGDDPITVPEAARLIMSMVKHACQDTRQAIEAEWSGRNDQD